VLVNRNGWNGYGSLVSDGAYWTSGAYGERDAICIYMVSGNIYPQYDCIRSWGASIRPVAE
jgi:hypothetical protein